MSQSSQQAVQYLDNLIGKLYQALRIKFSNISDVFDAVWPDPERGFNGHYFIPLPTGVKQQIIQYTWQDLYRKDVLNQLVPGAKITVDIDDIVGKAIHDRIQTTQQGITPKPYQHQVETIALALHALNNLREWLHNNTPHNVSLTKPFDILALLAPTASGKTEVLETVAIQLALDGKAAGFEATKVIMIYPMREFMKDHFIRFVRDLAYIKAQKNIDVTIGILNEDTPHVNDSPKKIENYLQIFFPTVQSGSSIKLVCPICGSELKWRNKGGGGNIEVWCAKGHDFTFIKFTREAIEQEPPDILLITPDMLNRLVMRYELYKKVFGIDSRGFPLLIVMDEPHLYSGVFGANVSLLIRDLRKLITTVAKGNFNVEYTPLILVTSATMPNAEVFLSKLFVTEPSKIKIVQLVQQAQLQLSSKGLITLLPRAKWGLHNASIELIPIVAALLPKDKRKILVFVDSVERAERLVYQIKDYISRDSGFWSEYHVCENVGSIFDPSVCINGRPYYNFIEVRSLSAKIPSAVRNETARKFIRGDVNVLIATSAVEVGVDVGDVDIAVLIGLPPTPINFDQRVGRVGRRGQPSLVIVLGNEESGVDVYYLSNLNRLIDYIRSSRKYEIPINPANPYAIRAYIGNFMTSLTWKISSPYIQTSSINIQNKINEYVKITIDDPINIFLQASQYPQLALIAQYLRSNGNVLKKQLNYFANAILNVVKAIGRKIKISNFASNDWNQISQSWSDILREEFGLVEIKTPLENIRSLGTDVDLEFKVKVANRRPFLLKDDIISSISTYSISKLPAFKREKEAFDGELKPTQSLLGVVTLKPVPFPNKGIIEIPFEVVGGSFVPFIPPTGSKNLEQKLKDLKDYLNDTIRTLDEILSISALDEILSKSSYSETRRIYRKVAIKLKDALNNYLNNVLQNVINDYNSGRPIEREKLKIVKPRKWIFRILEPLCFIDNSDKVVCVQDAGEIKHENVRKFLFYYEVKTDRRPQFVNKIFIEKPISFVDRDDYDRKNGDLILLTKQQRNISYINDIKHSQGSIRVANQVITYPLVTPILIDEGKEIRKVIGRNSVEIALKVVKLLYANVGYTIRTPIPNTYAYAKFVDEKEKPAIIGDELETYAVKITINWTRWFEDLCIANKKLCDALISEIEQDLKDLEIRNVPPIKKVFAITAAHSLAHILLNFHPLYTGGERKDLGELLMIKDESNTLKTEIYLFDTVHGGNGVSELLYSYLRDILNDALTVMLQRHIRSEKSDRFYGEPGDVKLGSWPRCNYGNLASSRLWLLRFLAAHNGVDLSYWEGIVKSDGQVSFSFP